MRAWLRYWLCLLLPDGHPGFVSVDDGPSLCVRCGVELLD